MVGAETGADGGGDEAIFDDDPVRFGSGLNEALPVAKPSLRIDVFPTPPLLLPPNVGLYAF